MDPVVEFRLDAGLKYLHLPSFQTNPGLEKMKGQILANTGATKLPGRGNHFRREQSPGEALDSFNSFCLIQLQES